MKKGRENKGGKFVEFLESIKKADAFGDAYLVQLVREAAEGNKDLNRKPVWQAAAWLLERRNPKEWGRRDDVNLNHSGAVKPLSFDKSAQDKILEEEAEDDDELEIDVEEP